ncbi:hypothetical protein TNIN_63251 [Trichonephila inaurata madagascariensis]|uniref:Uncharacterized protein n=1 Tax=Trichonephila inaurata madagascariensis TaxID=2747483 RepID=A0A8X6IJQ3_9ARAC|nr:hypothetical protein TNIN_63251 [Trichonephila inaurata madagascariensis]
MDHLILSREEQKLITKHKTHIENAKHVHISLPDVNTPTNKHDPIVANVQGKQENIHALKKFIEKKMEAQKRKHEQRNTVKSNVPVITISDSSDSDGFDADSSDSDGFDADISNSDDFDADISNSDSSNSVSSDSEKSNSVSSDSEKSNSHCSDSDSSDSDSSDSDSLDDAVFGCQLKRKRKLIEVLRVAPANCAAVLGYVVVEVKSEKSSNSSKSTPAPSLIPQSNPNKIDLLEPVKKQPRLLTPLVIDGKIFNPELLKLNVFGNVIMIPEDSSGENGPSVDELLSMSATQIDLLISSAQSQ